MKKLVILMVFVSLFAQETTHEVKIGDTLWDIAGWYYQDPFLWPYIWRANLTVVEDPHWIYPEEVLVIPPHPEEGVMPEVPEYTYTYEPTMPTKPGAELIVAVKPEERIFSEEIIHRAGFLIEEEMPYWGEIIGTEPLGEKIIASYKTVYINRAEDVDVGQVLTVYRPGGSVKHPVTGAFLGNEIIVLGKVKIEEIGEEGSRCEVIASYDIIRNGDRVFPYEPILAPENVELLETEKDIEGYVVEVKDDNLMTPTHVFAYVDHGEETGVAVGDVFEVYQERNVGGREMPDFTIGKIQIISVFRNASIGLLLSERETTKVERGEKCRLALEAR